MSTKKKDNTIGEMVLEKRERNRAISRPAWRPARWRL